MRIVSLLPSATEIFCALGLRDDLLAITHECDFPPGIQNLPKITSSRISHEFMSSREIDHSVRQQLDGHGTIYNLDTETLSKLKPDLIVTQELCEVCAVSFNIVSRAVRIFTSESQIVSLEPNTIEDVFSTIKTLGEMTGRSARASILIAELNEKLAKLKQKTHNISRKPGVMMLEWLEPPFAPGHWVPEQVLAAGGIPLLANEGQPSKTIGYNDIFDADPDILVLIPCGYYIEDILRQLRNVWFPGYFDSIKAIRNGNIWALDATSYFSRPGPRIITGAEILAKVFHPEIFGSPSASEAVRISPNLIQFQR
jgi:iron complex transport system substrate-binding protein